MYIFGLLYSAPKRHVKIAREATEKDKEQDKEEEAAAKKWDLVQIFDAIFLKIASKSSRTHWPTCWSLAVDAIHPFSQNP